MTGPDDTPDQRPAYKRRPKVVGGIVIFVIALGILAAAIHPGGHSNSGNPATATSSEPTTGTWVTVTGTPGVNSQAEASITYTTSSGTRQVTNVSLPWRDETSSGPVTVVAQGGANTYGISCEITRNGNQVASNTSNGEYAVVTCSAS